MHFLLYIHSIYNGFITTIEKYFTECLFLDVVCIITTDNIITCTMCTPDCPEKKYICRLILTTRNKSFKGLQSSTLQKIVSKKIVPFMISKYITRNVQNDSIQSICNMWKKTLTFIITIYSERECLSYRCVLYSFNNFVSYGSLWVPCMKNRAATRYYVVATR